MNRVARGATAPGVAVFLAKSLDALRLHVCDTGQQLHPYHRTSSSVRTYQKGREIRETAIQLGINTVSARSCWSCTEMYSSTPRKFSGETTENFVKARIQRHFGIFYYYLMNK